MWLCTSLGFFSINRKDPPDVPQTTYHVRGRASADLEALASELELVLKGQTIRVHELANSDYQYRLILGPDQMPALFGLMLESVTYSNFKTHLVGTPQEDKLDVYHKWWGDALAKFSDDDPFGDGWGNALDPNEPQVSPQASLFDPQEHPEIETYDPEASTDTEAPAFLGAYIGTPADPMAPFDLVAKQEEAEEMVDASGFDWKKGAQKPKPTAVDVVASELDAMKAGYMFDEHTGMWVHPTTGEEWSSK